ncbi:MAG: GntR family transcriptional regulator [Rhodocyclaceae bacterium]|nr:GntR family transcriptional regulator [Rhodocyclaceae bacterium]MBX3668017.1 GntR family transcriptional regulator [Rhodocyclaceae bacterium]
MAHESPTFSPLYRQIKDLIIQGLQSGEWRPGEAIPSEVELAHRFNVSQGTVRKAIDELAAEHLLVRKQGKGTFVSSHADPRAFFRFLRLVRQDGQIEPAQSVPLECLRARAGVEAARVLEIQPGDAIVVMRRVLRFGGKTLVVDEIYLPGDLFGSMTLEVLQTYQGSLYSLFESRFGVRIIRATEKIRAVAADRSSGDILAVPEGTPLLSVERVTYTYQDRPVEWRRGLYCTNEYFYLNELT